MARKPASASRGMLSRSMRASPRLSVRIRRRTSADKRKSAAAEAKTQPTLAKASSTPPSAGPAKMATLSIVVVVAFAAVNSSGERASAGSSAAGTVGEDRQRDLVSPLAEHGSAPRELEPAQILVGEDRRKRTERLAESPAQGGPHGRRMAAALEFLKQPTEDPADGGRLAGAFSVSNQEVHHGGRARQVRQRSRPGRRGRGAQVQPGRRQVREVRRLVG